MDRPSERLAVLEARLNVIDSHLTRLQGVVIRLTDTLMQLREENATRDQMIDVKATVVPTETD